MKEKESVKVNLILIDDTRMRRIKRDWFGKSESSDVVAFPIQEEWPDGTYLLGEVVVNLDQAKRQAKNNRVPLAEELVRLVAHGALHLLGFDDQAPSDWKTMEKLQEKIVRDSI